MADIIQEFPDKRVDEDLNLWFDFENWLASGETLTVASNWVATVKQGTDASPGDIVSGSASISGTKSVQKIVDGVDGVTYYLVARVTTSDGQILEGLGTLKVDDVES